MEKKRSRWWYLVYGIAVSPFLGCCLIFGAFNHIRGGFIDERRKAGEAFVAGLPASAANVPEHLHYEAYEDGGFQLYFAEPGLLGPSDFYSVWNPKTRRWDTVDDLTLFHLQ